MHGLQHIKVQQADGPGGIKLYSIKVKQKSPRLVRNERIKDSIEVERKDSNARRKGDTLNETFRFLESNQDECLSPLSPNPKITQASRAFNVIPGQIDLILKSQETADSVQESSHHQQHDQMSQLRKESRVEDETGGHS